MNGERTFGDPIPNKMISEVMNQLFNGWFKKWRTVELDDAKFNLAFDELYADIMRKYDQYPVVSHLAISLLYELDARMHGGYTETSKGKLLMTIKNEGVE